MGLNVLYAEPPECRNINVRKEGNGDDAPLCVDVKVVGIAYHDDYKLMTKLLGCNKQQAKNLWSDNENQEPAYPFLDEFETIATFEEGQHCQLAKKDFKNIRVKGIKLKPIGNGSVRLSLTIQIPGVEKKLIAFLADKIKKKLEVVIYADADLFDDVEDLPVAEALSGETQEDPIYGDAVKYVREHGKASVSRLQQGFQIGFNRSALIIAQMVADEVVKEVDGGFEVIFEGVEKQADIEGSE